MKKNRLIIHAPNIHIGGGAVLLTALLSALVERYEEVFLILDQRYEKPALPLKFHCHTFPASLIGRFQAELFLYKLAGLNDTVLCFGNLPPLFGLPASVYLVLQNRNLLGINSLRQFPKKIACRIFIERLWLRWFKSNVNAIIVQTQTMQLATEQSLGEEIPVIICPWAMHSITVTPENSNHRQDGFTYDFIYVATPDAHKNHRQLIDAWCLLAEQNIRPRLALTINPEKSPELWQWITHKIQLHDLQITNVGHVPYAEINQLYQQSQALIFPSTSEAFGLPLIEAHQAGLSILAGELDYVRDLLDPEQTFDPNSPVSISRAVLRFMKKPSPAFVLHSPKEFIEFLSQLNNELSKQEITCAS